MEITFHSKFKKAYAKLSPKVQAAFAERLHLFMTDPHNPTLNNHTLRGNLSHFRSINVSGDIRAWYSISDEQKVQFMKIGSHSELYG